MTSLFDRAKSLSKLWHLKKKDKRGRNKPQTTTTTPVSPSPPAKKTTNGMGSASPIDFTGETFTMRLMRPEMREFHRERVRRESMASGSDCSSVCSSVCSTFSEPVTRQPRTVRFAQSRRYSSLDSAATTTSSCRRGQRACADLSHTTGRRSRLYRIEITQSVCDPDVMSVCSEDQIDLLSKIDKMEAELRERDIDVGSQRCDSATPIHDTSGSVTAASSAAVFRSASVSDADSGLDSESVVTASSQSGASSLSRTDKPKGVRFLFPDSLTPVLYPEKGELDQIRSDDEDLDSDEEYLGRI
eukprot:m.4938 g.4938  ORF g.4938 m.4938 type:complete len:301 (+) comp11662_c0_seq2:330-1232(+)